MQSNSSWKKKFVWFGSSSRLSCQNTHKWTVDEEPIKIVKLLSFVYCIIKYHPNRCKHNNLKQKTLAYQVRIVEVHSSERGKWWLLNHPSFLRKLPPFASKEDYWLFTKSHNKLMEKHFLRTWTALFTLNKTRPVQTSFMIAVRPGLLLHYKYKL